VAVGLVTVVLVVLVVLVEVLGSVVSADSLNATGALALPGWLDELTHRSVVAYPAHAALGTALEALDLSPSATGVQWLKAAAHATSDADIERTARGIAAAQARDDDNGRVLRTLCALKEFGNPGQVRAVARANVRCDRWTPEVALEANGTPLMARAGSPVRIAASVTSATSVVGLVDLEIHDAEGEKVAQWVFPEQELVAEQRHIYVVVWEVSSTLPPGEYEVKLGVFKRGWAVLHGWKNSAALITVTP
jgi:hypothetical protein